MQWWQPARQSKSASAQPLTELRRLLQAAHKDEATWAYTGRFAELKAAKAWHRTSSEWDALSKAAREEMYAHWRTEVTMAAWEEHLQAQRLAKLQAQLGE